MKYVFLTMIAILVLTACTNAVSQEEPVTNLHEDEAIIYDETTTTQEQTQGAQDISRNHDIEIISGKLEPREVTIPVNIESNIVVHNKQEHNARVDIQFVGDTQSVTVAPGQYEVITVHPKITGIAAIQLNNQQLGTIFIK